MNSNYVEVLNEVLINQIGFTIFVPTIIATVGYYGVREEQKKMIKRELLQKLEQEKKRVNQSYNFTVANIEPRTFKSGQLGEYNFIVE